jgi:hypothetical protein
MTKKQRALTTVRRAPESSAAYTIRETVSDANTVREYISPAGIVFAVAWNGVAHPDLTTLLGSYLDEYQQAVKQPRKGAGRRHSRVQADHVVVEKWGQMRNMKGRAYDPALLPAGVPIDDIR